MLTLLLSVMPSILIALANRLSHEIGELLIGFSSEFFRCIHKETSIAFHGNGSAGIPEKVLPKFFSKDAHIQEAAAEYFKTILLADLPAGLRSFGDAGLVRAAWQMVRARGLSGRAALKATVTLLRDADSRQELREAQADARAACNRPDRAH